MEVKPGYKHTEVGVIPEEWDVKPLAAIADRIMVGIASAATHAYRTNGVPMFRNQDIKNGHLNDSNLLFIAPEYESTFKNKRLRGGDLLTMRTGYPGVTAIVPDRYESAQSFTTLITRPKQKEAESSFLCHYINSEIGQRFFTQSQIGGAQKNVNAGTLRQMPVPLPKSIEQRAIAEALSDVDALLGALDRLIAKKRDLKQAAMQQLLTGKTRLPGFEGEWVVKRLGDLFNFSGGYSASRDQLSSNGHCYLHYGDIHGSSKTCIDTAVDFQNIPKLDIPLKSVSSSSLLADGDIVFVDASEDDEGTSKHVVVVNKGKKPFISGLHTIVAKSKTDELAHIYRRYCFQTRAIQQQFLFYSVGTKVSGISKSNIPKLMLSYPGIPEQTAIAEVLLDMDAELTALTQRRDKTQVLKQGMMQELLTGRTRLL